MVNVGKTVRDVVKTMLADGTVGFNATLASVCTSYGIAPFTIDFTGNKNNFLQGYYGAKDLAETTNVKFPVICLYTTRSQNTNENKFAIFSGSVEIGIDTYLSHGKSAAVADTEALADAVESTYYTLFNSSTNYHFYGQAGYNGDLYVQRSPVSKGAANWIQTLNSRLTFELTAQ